MQTILETTTDIPEEQLRVRAKCFHPSGAFEEFKKQDIDQSIPHRFEQIVTKYPHRIAVKDQDQQYSYLKLNSAANRIAHGLLRLSHKKPEPIAVLLEQGISPIIAVLGVLKTGNFYVPLEPSYPKSRINYILRDSKAPLILANDVNIALAQDLAQDGILLMNIDQLDADLSSENPDLFISPDDYAYIMYTSGSTGQPKGVVDIHRNILHEIMILTNALHLSKYDKQTLIRSFSFNGSVRDIFGSLLTGASLHPLNIVDKGIDYLAGWLIDEQITVYRSVISTFRNFASTLTAGEHFPDLRLIHVGGEAINTKDVKLFKSVFAPNCIFLPGLGITETGSVSYFFIDKSTQIAGDVVPVGYPIENKEIILFDNQGHKIGFNNIGEIAVRSQYLSPGYWNKPELTSARYLPVSDDSDERIYLTGDLGKKLPDGCLLHLGRKDFQVQIRGHRVEVAEIETVLLRIDAIKEAFVIAQDDSSGNQYLVAYLVPGILPGPTVTNLRKTLAEELPDYMIPSRFVMVDAIPLTPSGKVNRRALPLPGRIRPKLGNPYIAPRTPVEGGLVEIWDEVLGLDQVGIDDSFFDLGGNSLLAGQVISRVIHTFRVKVPLRSLFRAPTIADMATVIVQGQIAKAESQEIDNFLAELEALSDEEVLRVYGSEEKKGGHRKKQS
jgi:amino acid adenylation domain-containing protein